MNKFRTVTVFMAVVSLLFFVAVNWIDLPISQEIEEVAQLVAAVLVALGVLANTGDTSSLQPLTWTYILEKLKSPIAVGALYALLAYLVYLRLAPAEADALLKVIDTIIVAIFGFSVYNNPNARNALR